MHGLWLICLLVGAFALATGLEPRFRQWSQRKTPPQRLLAALLGDSRRLFANHFFIKSDVYLHGGYYPSIFNNPDRFHNAAAESAGVQEAARGEKDEPGHSCHGSCHHAEHDFLGPPRNWIDAFGRHFFPTRHIHLGEGDRPRAEAREILPWIKLAAELDPHRTETYTVGAYWLRQVNKTGEALQFLREGLRHNPRSPEILFELGRCYEQQADPERARNLWELALRRWQEREAHRDSPDNFMLAQILTHLARLEVRAGRRDVAVHHLEMLRAVSPAPQAVQQRIEEVKAGQPFEATP